MRDYLLTKRKLEFKKIVIEWQSLPKIWKLKFEDGQDMRIWFNKLISLGSHDKYIAEISNILANYNIKILTDIEKEKEFMNIVKKNKRIPERGTLYFCDNVEMYTWYMNYKRNNSEYAKKINKITSEYKDFDLESIWKYIKPEFLLIIKRLKRVPDYGEAILSNYNLDVRTVYEKLEKEDKPRYEQALLHLETYKDKSLSMDDKLKELKLKVKVLGYLPEFKEYTFSDGIDMFTWYTKYKDNLPVIGEHIEPLLNGEHPNKNKLVNVYTIPQFKTKTGESYNININSKEKLDLSDIVSYEQKISNINSKEKLSFTDIKKGISE